jgi:hypothetical protein
MPSAVVGMAVLLAVGEPSQATMRREEVRKSFTEAMVTYCAQETGRRRGRAGRSTRPWTPVSSDGHHRDMHGHSGPHLGKAAMSEARYVKAGPRGSLRSSGESKMARASLAVVLMAWWPCGTAVAAAAALARRAK